MREPPWLHTLSVEDRARATAAGRDRDVAPGRSGTVVGPPAGLTKTENEIASTGAEIAVARLLGCDWREGLGPDRERGDLCGPFPIDVRWTRYASGHLAIKAGDIPRRIFVLATGDFPDYAAHGWMRAEEAHAHPEWWREHPTMPAFWVPQAALHEMQTLLDEVVRAIAREKCRLDWCSGSDSSSGSSSAASSGGS